METRSQFTGRYKKDLSTDHLRAKVARRKSITQKENRHKEFRKSRGLSLVDVNVSHVKNGELSTLDEVFEASLSKEKENKENKTATVKNNDKLLNQRREMLLRFKEEKQLRKLKEQREKAGRGTFRCGIYKPDVTVPPVFSSQNAGKAKVTEKPAPPTRVTRSMAKTEPTVKATTRTQHVTAPLLNKSKITAERSVPKGRGPISTVKKTEKEQKALTTVPLATRAKTTAAVTKVPSKITAVAKPPRKTVNEIKPNKTAKNEDVVEKQIVEHSSVEDDEPPNVTKAPTFEIGTLKEACVTVKERKPSFAPQNFMFQPLEGLSAFKFQPMTPHRVDEFLTPGYMWSPVQPERLNVAISPKPKTEEHSEPLPTEQTPDICELQMDTNLCAPQESECTGDTCSGALDVQPPVSPVTSEEVTQTESVPAAPEEPKHDVLYFRNVLKSELQRLTELCSRWNERIEIDIPEEAKDLIRTTVGQTRLLMTERFKQFEGLVDNCEFKRGEKETTCTDLEGFWDMVYFQIEDVVNKFVNLEKLEKNSWQQQTSVQTKKVVKKKMASVTATKPSQDDNGRAAARSRLAAIKAALKNKGKPEQPEVQVADPEQPAQVVFEAGFFRIESPAKVVRGIRTTQTPKSLLKSLKNSENPASNSAANENVDAPNTSDDGSPVRKMLFDSAEESVPEPASCPKSAELEGVEAYSASCVDLGKYLVPVAHFSLDLRESSVFAQLSTQTDEFPLAGESVSRGESIVDDVFMSSPEKVPHETTVCSATESHGMCEAGELKPGCALLEFLGHCTPSHLAEVKRVSRRLGAVVETNDLIVFSPLEK